MELGSLTFLSGVLGKHPSPLNLPRLCFTSKTHPPSLTTHLCLYPSFYLRVS